MTKPMEISALCRQIESLASGQDRIIVALAGPPGCGKSTLAAELVRQINLPCCIVPMDGFHFDNDTLSRRGLLAQKGAPETFDLPGFARLIATLLQDATDRFPTFDRDTDCVDPIGGNIPADTRILFVEGNYLLFDEPGWADLASHWNASVWINVPKSVLEERLIRRWIYQGMSNDAALERAQSNDMANMRRILDRALSATWVIKP